MILYIVIAVVISIHGSAAHYEPLQPQPYSFGYTIKDKGSVQHREEIGNGAGMVKGNYGFIDNKGLHRQVDYVADHGGFRAQVKTNEPGTSGESPAAVHMISHPSHGIHGYPIASSHQAYGYGREHLPAHDRYKFMTPLHEHAPLHHNEHHIPAHMPVHEHVVPHIPVHGHIASHHDHELHVPVHSPHHVSIHAPTHGLASPLHGHDYGHHHN